MKKKLGEILVTSGAVSEADIEAALSDQSAGEPNRLGDLLVATGKLSSSQLARALGEQYGLPFVELPSLPQAVLDLVPLELQRQFRFVPMRCEGTELSIAMADLANIEVLALLEQQWTAVHVHVAASDEIDALHATLSGLFSLPGEPLPDVAPSIAPAGHHDDLFGSFELEGEAEAAPTPFSASASPVPVIAPVQARPPAVAASARPGVDDLFGDLNLESARTGIAARPPEDELGEPPPPVEPAREQELFGDLNLESARSGIESQPPLEAAAEPVPAEVFPEGSGPLLDGVREGTGPLLDMLAREGTGPVVDTPFFRDALGSLVPTVSDHPFPSSPSSLSALAIPPPPAKVVPPETRPRAPPIASSPSMEALPDWLKNEAAAPLTSPPVPDGDPQSWTGALDHLMPSRLVVGLTRALLARGQVTEEEILAALGEKK